MSQGELGAYVQTHLRSNGIDVVLSGGAVVAIYSSGRYVTYDLDLIDIHLASRGVIRRAMQAIGFQEQGRHFKHPESKYFVEFQSGPLTVGDEQVTRIDEIQLETGTLRVISPNDCVKDRLACFFHFGDRQCLAQAVLIAKDHAIDIADLRRWSRLEEKLSQFEEFKRELDR